MDKKPPKSSYNIDGFVPKRQGRHVGYGPDNPTQYNAIRGVPRRRPGFRTQQVPATPQQHGTLPAPIIDPAVRVGTSQRLVNEPAQRRQDTQTGNDRKRGRFLRRKKKVAEKPPKRWKKIVKRGAITVAVILVCTGGWLGYKIIHDTSKVFGGTSSLLGFLKPQKLKGQNTGRVNILLAGYSVDDPENTGGDLTDSIMLISIDTRNNTAFMLSVPRDLYVNIPGFGYAKINQAYEEGQSEHFSASGYPNGGMGLLEQVVSQDFGIPIDYYGLLDNRAVKEAVNAVGGVTIDIQSSDPRGIYDAFTHLKLPNGEDKLDGQQALNLVRARGDDVAGDVSYGLGSDFIRTEHQRQVLEAIEQKATSSAVLANPIKLGQLFDAFGNNVHTDLSTGNIRELYDLFKKIHSSNIQSIGLNDVNFDGNSEADLLQNYWTPDGEEALAPATGLGNYSQIQQLLTELTSNNPLVKEDANVVVLNGGNITGLAAYYQTSLTKQGVNVSVIGNAPTTVTNTTIIDQSSGKMPKTKAFLEKTFGNNVTTTNDEYDYPGADFIVVLGTNQQAPAGFSSSTSSTSSTGD